MLTKEILNTYINLKTLFKTSSIKPKKSLWSKISKEAANKGLSKLSTDASTATKAKQAIPKQDVLNTHLNLKSLFQKSNDDYDIHKLSSHYYANFNTNQTSWNITGCVSIHNVHSALSKLVNRTLLGQPENIPLQIYTWKLLITIIKLIY